MRRPAAIAFATGAAVCALCAPALAQNTPAQNQAQINSIPWTNGSGKVIGAAVSNLFSAINGTFGLYAPTCRPEHLDQHKHLPRPRHPPRRYGNKQRDDYDRTDISSGKGRDVQLERFDGNRRFYGYQVRYNVRCGAWVWS